MTAWLMTIKETFILFISKKGEKCVSVATLQSGVSMEMTERAELTRYRSLRKTTQLTSLLYYIFRTTKYLCKCHQGARIRGSPDGGANNERAEREREKKKHSGISLLSSIFLTEWGLNLTDGMKETIIALICRIMATVKRTETNWQNKSRFMERGLNGRRKEIGRGGSEISGENLSSERADGNI